jgi:hypothetical protein
VTLRVGPTCCHVSQYNVPSSIVTVGDTVFSDFVFSVNDDRIEFHRQVHVSLMDFTLMFLYQKKGNQFKEREY